MIQTNVKYFYIYNYFIRRKMKQRKPKIPISATPRASIFASAISREGITLAQFFSHSASALTLKSARAYRYIRAASPYLLERIVARAQSEKTSSCDHL